MKYIKQTIISFLLCTNLYANETLNVEKNVSLDDLKQIALKNNTSIKINQYKEESKIANIDLSKANYMPKVSLTGEAARYDIENSQSKTNDTVNSVTINASQTIYDFGKTKSAVSASKQSYKASKKETQAVVNNILLSVEKAYYNILNQNQLIKVAQEAILIDSLQYEQAQEYLKAGVRTKIDVTNAKLQLSNSKLELIKAKYKLKSAKTQLTSILGIQVNDSFNIITESKNIDELIKNISFYAFELSTLVTNGLENRPELKMYDSLLNSQKSKIKNVKSEYLPSLDLDASYLDKNSDNVNLDTNQWTAGVYLKWTLFSGLSTKASLKDNIASLQSIKNQLKQQELTIIQEVTDAFFTLKENEESLNISSLNVELAIQNLDLAKQRYKAGLSDLVELNDAKLEYTKAKSDLVNIYYSYFTANSDLEYAMGIIHKDK